MSEKNIFELAVRGKMRFPYRGVVSVEDLFDLDVKSLDSIFKTLNAELKQSKSELEEESLLETKTKQNQELETKVEIVKYIVQLKLNEQAERQDFKAKKEQKEKIMAILAEKQDEGLKGKTVEELQAMLAGI